LLAELVLMLLALLFLALALLAWALRALLLMLLTLELLVLAELLLVLAQTPQAFLVSLLPLEVFAACFESAVALGLS